MFKPDTPINKREDDLLGRADFARSFADGILSYKETESIVTGLYGEWGAGKSSVINMCVEHVEQEAQKIEKDLKPIVVRFNPWNYSDQNQLIAQFFKQLSLSLKRKDLSADAINAADQLEAYAEFFEPLALIPDPTVGSFALLMSGLLKKFGKASRKWGELKKKDLEATRLELDRLLSKQKQKIIIIIDDIDRLNSNEIRQMFQLVKLLGDFPNTIYLLSFDSKIVIESLKEVQAGVGDEYLEKIIQIPFELPATDLEAVNRYLCSLIDRLISDIPEESWDSTYWGNIYHSGLKGFFTNLRDVTRYINILSFGLEPIKHEINAIDFMALTGLQVFEPEVYRGIRDNKDLFSGLISSGYGSEQRVKDQMKVRCDEILSRSKNISADDLQDHLSRIFPKLKGIYGNHGYSGEFLLDWRREGRACSPDKFDIFFKLSIPEGDIAESEIRAILSTAVTEETFAVALKSLCDDGRIVRFLERVEDYTREAIPLEHIPAIANVLMDLGDIFPAGEEGFYATNTSSRLLRILYQLTKRFETQQERFDIYKQAIEKSNNSLYTGVHEVGVHGQHHGKNTSKEDDQLKPEENRPVSAEQLLELESLALDKVRNWAEDGRLRGHRNLISILYSWRNFTDSYDEPKAFVAEIIKDIDGIIELIGCFSGKSFSHGMEDYVAKQHIRINMDSVKDFVDPAKLAEQVRPLTEGDQAENITEEQLNVLKVFIDTFDGKIEEH
jgi:predicted KAP-like P-loop ATPase